MFQSLTITIEFDGVKWGYTFPVMVDSLTGNPEELITSAIYGVSEIIGGIPGGVKDKFIDLLIHKWAHEEALNIIAREQGEAKTPKIKRPPPPETERW